MDEDIEIINTQTRNEKIKNFFINNKNSLISILVIIILAKIIITNIEIKEFLLFMKKFLIFSLRVWVFIISISSSIKSCS